MLKTVSAIKARQNLGQVMNEVSLKDDEYIVERSGKPLVAIIPIEKYLNMKVSVKNFSDYTALCRKLRIVPPLLMRIFQMP
ncbi:MAG: type II toxin-antitoxin system Phd/YefM family antitoxin [Nitrospirae bacterium]|nr:type II toxin-antitoxin system Phd/YefM family antitoxin [Nitrospirota bacterium]